MDQLLKDILQKNDLQTFNSTLEKLHSYTTPEKLQDLVKSVKNILKTYQRTFQKKYSLPKDVVIYDHPIYWIFLQIEQIYKCTKTKDVLEGILEYCKSFSDDFNFRDVKPTSFSLDDEVKLLKNVDSKYKVFDTVKKAKKKIVMFNFPFTCNEEFTFMVKEIKKDTYLEALIMQSNQKNGVLINYTRMVSLIYNALIMDDPFEIPFGFCKILSYLEQKKQMTKEEGLALFVEFFGYSLLYDTKYKELIGEIPCFLGESLVVFFQNVVTYCYPESAGEWIELSNEAMCPCGSNKPYQICCKKKQLKWGYRDGEIFKQVPLAKPVINAIEDIEKLMLEVLNRKPKPNDRIFNLISNNDIHINNQIKMLRKIGLDEKKLYASYKIELVLTEMNVMVLPDFEEENWKKAIQEYENITKDENNILFQIRAIDSYLHELWSTYLTQATYILSLIMNDLRDDYLEITKFRIDNVFDFAAFCSERVRKNNEALSDALEKEHYEVSMAINRMMYEDLLNANVYFQNEILFEKHIMTISKIDQGIYRKLEKNGKVSTKTAVNPATQETINYSITLKELSEKANENYNELYEKLFRDLSNFTHLNVAATDHYFENPDPFYDIDPINISGILGLFLVNQIIFEFSNLKTSDFVHRDIIYFTDKIKELLIPAFLKIKEIYPLQSSLYDTLIECVSDYKFIK